MSYANGTTNYNLPQTVGTDKRDWSDTNQAFYDVDAALKAASDGASQAAEDITALTTRVGTAEDDILALKGEDISLDGRLDTAEGAISTLQLQLPDVRSDLEDMITAYNEATATSTHAYSEGDYFIYNDVLYKATTSIGIGDTIVPNTNCSATNVTTEIDDVKSALAGKEDTITPSSVSVTWGSTVTAAGSVVKYGDTISFSVDVSFSGGLTAGTYYQIGHLNEHRPNTTTYIIGVIDNSDLDSVIGYIDASDGSIHIKPPVNVTIEHIIINSSYITVI